MSQGPAIALVACLAATSLVLVLIAHRAWLLTSRLRSLARPLHELRGALGALTLAVTTMERAAEKEPGLEAWLGALRLPLERANLGVRDVDACRNGGRKAGSPPLDHPLDLRAVVVESVRAWARLAPSYAARLRLDWRAGPVCARGSAARLRQAIDNLIANALEHGGGRVLVEGELQGACARIKVSDGGPGLGRAPEQLTEAPGSSARGHGLAIAYDAVRAHGGRLVAGLGRHGPALVVELPAEAAPETAGAGRGWQPQSAEAVSRARSGAPSAA